MAAYEPMNLGVQDVMGDTQWKCIYKYPLDLV
jgi:hypothetical protein